MKKKQQVIRQRVIRIEGKDLDITKIQADLKKMRVAETYLKKGLVEWNRWRQQHEHELPNLAHIDLEHIDLRGCNLSKVDLSYARLNHANLSRSDLSGATLHEAELVQADLSGAILTDTDLSSITADATVFGDLDLSQTRGLESVRHRGRSTIGVDTIFLSHGEIPEVFLRGVGVPDSFIEYMRSLVGKPIDYYSCFISYSSNDEEFAKRLYNDLQGAGVRCWFAPEDLKTGDKFWERIDAGIRIYEKLLVILSENSIASPWVEEEVTTALEKEHLQPGTTVLFPVRLDMAVMTTTRHWAASLRRNRHITDCSGWKDHDTYQQAFERLLRDLKAASS